MLALMFTSHESQFSLFIHIVLLQHRRHTHTHHSKLRRNTCLSRITLSRRRRW